MVATTKRVEPWQIAVIQESCAAIMGNLPKGATREQCHEALLLFLGSAGTFMFMFNDRKLTEDDLTSVAHAGYKAMCEAMNAIEGR